VTDLDSWGFGGLTTVAGNRVHAGRLFQLLDDGIARRDGGCLVVPHSAIAQMSAMQLEGIGLPAICPYALVVESGQFSITQLNFDLRRNSVIRRAAV